MKYQLAQMNVTTLVDLPGHESNAEFLPVLETVNAIAEVSPGFVGRLKDESGQSSAFITSDGDPIPPASPSKTQSLPSGGTVVANLFGYRFPHLPCSDAFAARGDVGGSESGLQHGLDGVFDRSCLFLEFQ